MFSKRLSCSSQSLARASRSDACGAVLLQQVVDKVEAARYLFGAGGVEVDALALAFEFVGDVAYFNACAVEAFGERGGFGQMGGDAFQLLRGAAQFGEAFAVAAVDGEGGRAERSLDFLGMFQERVLFFQFLLLVG